VSPRRLSNAERDLAALDAFKARPCTWCEREPKASGDHLCSGCRTAWNAAQQDPDRLHQLGAMARRLP